MNLDERILSDEEEAEVTAFTSLLQDRLKLALVSDLIKCIVPLTSVLYHHHYPNQLAPLLISTDQYFVPLS